MKRVNLPIAVASTLLSLMIWMLVYSQNIEPLRPVPYTAKLTQQGLDSERFAITRIDEFIRFTVVGPEERIGDFAATDLVAVVELENAREGTDLYPVQIFPQEVMRYVSGKPLFTRVEIEPVERKRVPVQIEGTGSLAVEGRRLSGTLSDPNEVTLTGAESAVARVARVRALLDLGAVREGDRNPGFTVGVEALDRTGAPVEGVRAEPLFVRVTPILAIAPEETEAIVKPEFTGQPAPGYESTGYSIEPTQVTIRGRALDIAAITTIQTEPINVEGLRSTQTFTVPLIIPAGTRLAERDRQVRVTYRVRPAPRPSPPPPEPQPKAPEPKALSPGDGDPVITP